MVSFLNADSPGVESAMLLTVGVADESAVVSVSRNLMYFAESDCTVLSEPSAAQSLHVEKSSDVEVSTVTLVPVGVSAVSVT